MLHYPQHLLEIGALFKLLLGGQHDEMLEGLRPFVPQTSDGLGQDFLATSHRLEAASSVAFLHALQVCLGVNRIDLKGLPCGGWFNLILEKLHYFR